MSYKEIKRKWHVDNKNFVFDYFKGICQTCEKTINKNTTKFDIHHLHYNLSQTSIKGKLYETDAKTLIENNVITLICRPCHDIEHTAKDPNNPQQFENKYPCKLCGNNERGIFGRKNQQKLDKLLCRKCFLKLKQKNENQLLLFCS